MKVHVGAGKHVLDGWTNVDAVRHPAASRAPEILHDLRTGPIPLADGCATEVMAIHVIEHFVRWEVDAIVADWKRLLRPGGRLVLEMPDIALCARNLLAGGTDQMTMWGFYGDPSHRDELMTHRYGWTPKTATQLLVSHGFRDIRTGPPQMHGRRANRDMRVEGVKP